MALTPIGLTRISALRQVHRMYPLVIEVKPVVTRSELEDETLILPWKVLNLVIYARFF